MKKNRFIVVAIIAVLIAAVFAFNFKTSEKGKEGGIKWLTMEQAIQASKKEKRKVFIDVYTDWCGWCKKMDAATFSNAKAAEYVNKKYYAVKLDAESMKTFDYKGQTVSERELAGRIFGVNGYPTTVYLDENLDLLSPVQGYLEIGMWEKILKFYGEDVYKKQSWQDFESSYKGSF